MRTVFKLAFVALFLAAAAGVAYYLLTPRVDYQAEAEKLIPALNGEAATRPARPPAPPAPRTDHFQDPLYTLKGHTDGVTIVTFSPDGKILASGSGDHSIRLWDVATQKQIADLHGHSDPITALHFSPDGKFLLSTSTDSTALLWNLATREIDFRYIHSAAVVHAAFLPDGKHFISATFQLAQLWSTDSESPLRQTLHLSSTRDLDVWPSGIAAISQNDGTIFFWEPLSGKTIKRLKRPLVHTGSIDIDAPSRYPRILCLPGGDLLLGDDKGVFRWDHVADEFSLDASLPYIWSIKSAADQRFFVVRSSTLLFPISNTGSILANPLDTPDFHDMAISPDSTLLAIAKGGSWPTTDVWNSCGPTDISIYDLRHIHLPNPPASMQAIKATRPAATAPQK